jgi:predicted nucleic acid-binding protein
MLIVLGDANVLYPRVLRDYLLHAASSGALSIVWSSTIIDETVRHLEQNIAGFSKESGEVLRCLMNEAFPLAQIDPTPSDFARVKEFALPDEGDRHVLAAALAADADIICTSNIKDFPQEVIAALGISIQTPDSLLSSLAVSHPKKMFMAHRRAVSLLAGATDSTTIEALRKAGAPMTADAMAALVNSKRSC